MVMKMKMVMQRWGGGNSAGTEKHGDSRVESEGRSLSHDMMITTVSCEFWVGFVSYRNKCLQS